MFIGRKVVLVFDKILRGILALPGYKSYQIEYLMPLIREVLMILIFYILHHLFFRIGNPQITNNKMFSYIFSLKSVLPHFSKGRIDFHANFRQEEGHAQPKTSQGSRDNLPRYRGLLACNNRDNAGC